MKYLIKVNLWLLVFITASALLMSCVEEEQAPDFDKIGESSSDIDVKMPAPGDETYFAGSEILLKGSGFSAADEVYVQYANYRYDEELGYNEYIAEGPKVKAVVKDFTSTELTFIIPPEIIEGHDYGAGAFVFFKRNGQEYRLGLLENIRLFSIMINSNGTRMGGDIVSLTSYEPDFVFSDNDKVFLQSCVRDENGIQGVGEKISAEVESVNPSELRFVVPLNCVGEVLVIFEHNDIEYKVEGGLLITPPISVTTLDVVGGMEAELFLMSENLSFDNADKIYLQPVVVKDNGELVDNGDRIAATIKINGDKNLSFMVPVEAVGTYTVIWVHNRVECRMTNYFTVHFPVYSESDETWIGGTISLRSMVGYLFTSTDEVYLRPVGGGNKVKAEIVSIEEWVLLFTVPDLFQGASGRAVVIFKHNGVEYELNPQIRIYGNN